MSKTTKRVSDAVKPVLVHAISSQAYAALVAIPGFGWVFGLPVVRQVTQFIIDRLATWMVSETAVGLSILWISLEMSYEIGSAEDAKKKLQDMLDNPKKYTAAEQEKIEEEFDETTVDLIQLGIDRL